MADPRALRMATAAMYALEKIGYPEGLIPLSDAIVYVCEAPKSNAVVEAYHAARRDAVENKDDAIPLYLKDNSFGDSLAKAQSAKYLYPHNFGGYVEQQYLPDSLKDRVYYRPKDVGFESEVKRIRKEKGMKD